MACLTKELIENKKKISKYRIEMEISGQFACFSRPDSGSDKTSYSVPTFSAVKGMFESVLFIPTVEVVPIKVEICKPIRFQQYGFNSRVMSRKGNLINKDTATQLRFLVLTNVCYRVYACLINADIGRVEKFMSPAFDKYRNIQHSHSYMDQFNRRLKKNRCIRRPHLGFADFISDYFGEFRPKTIVESGLNFTIPSMSFLNFDQLTCGKIDIKNGFPLFVQNVEVKNGILEFV